MRAILMGVSQTWRGGLIGRAYDLSTNRIESGMFLLGWKTKLSRFINSLWITISTGAGGVKFHSVKLNISQ